jgi:hypothetical protein
MYVSLDTTRDYIYVDDCARMIVSGIDRLERSVLPDGPLVKILGSGMPVPIATITGYTPGCSGAGRRSCSANRRIGASRSGTCECARSCVA